MDILILGTQYALWSPFRPDSLYAPGKMVAGGETALVRVSQELAKQGHNITVFTHTDVDAQYDGARWVPMHHLKLMQETGQLPTGDIALSYDTPAALANVQARVLLVDNQTNNPEMAGAPAIDGYIFRSEWHADAVRRCTPGIPKEQCHVIGNGVDLELYAERDRVARVPGRLIWTSSPDRGLHHALRIFQRVHAQLPHTTLHVYYDFHKAFDGSMWGMDYRTQQLWEAKHLLDTVEGVTYVGPVDKRTLARAQMQAEVLLYPCDTSRPSEGFCGSILEALAAGCVPLISDCDALPELWGEHAPMLPLLIDYEEWVEMTCELLADGVARQHYREQGYERASQFAWRAIGEQYGALLARIYSEKPCPACGQRLAAVDIPAS